MAEKRFRKPKSNESLAKVIIIGDSGVGKTVLLKRYCEGIYSDTYTATIGVDFKIKQINIENKKYKLQIWDTAGQQRFRNITQTYYKGASGIILVYAINNEESFRNINNWIKQIDTNSSEDVCKLLIGSKCDLESQRRVQKEEGERIAAKYGMGFIEVSAKEGNNVEQAFEKLAKDIKIKKQTAQDDPHGGKGLSLKEVEGNEDKKRCQC